MARKLGMIFVAAICTVTISSAQTVSSPQMTLDEFRHFLDVMHIKDADERGVRLQMKATVAQLPVWWPAHITDLMITSMLQVDFPGINYGYVKSCTTSHQIALLTEIFSTADGQRYVAKATGNMVEQEGKGINPADARESVIDRDTGIPNGAFQGLAPAEKSEAKTLFTGDVMNCMNNGYKKASIDVTEARTQAARAVIAEHKDEIAEAKAKYDAAHSTQAK